MKKLKDVLKISFLLICTCVFSQELPPIENYSPEEYLAGSQNWDISQSLEKYIYVGNNSGLLEFNGAVWKLYPSPNGTIIRSVNVVDNLIYTGCYMEFGYWEKDDFGNLNYFSLSKNLAQPLIDDEHFWNILKFNDRILFQSLDRIYVYNTLDGSFNIINSKTTRAALFKIGNNIYFQKINEGVYKIENGKPVLVSNHPILKKNTLAGIFLVDKKILLLTEQGEFYFLTGQGLIKWDIVADKELSSINVYSSLQLNDGSFMLGTISDGVYHVGINGEFIKKINRQKGLNNNTVLSIYQDFDHNIWLGLDKGIGLINLNSPFSIYNDFKGELGAVSSSIIFENHLYIGTNQGLFYKELNTQKEFKLIENTKGQVWCLEKIENTLFCGHNSGTYIIDQKKAKKISSFPGTWDIRSVENNKDLLVQGNYTGLSILQKINDQWQFRNRIEGFDISSRYFEFVDKDKIIVNHEFKGIFNLVIDSDFSKVLKINRIDPIGSGSSLVNYKNDIVYSSSNGVFKFNSQKKEFIKDSVLSSKFLSLDDMMTGRLIFNDKRDKLWGFSDKNIICVTPGKFDNILQSIKISIPNFFRESLGLLSFESITHLNDENYLIGSSSGYTVLNLDNLESKDYTVKINSIEKEFLDADNQRASLVQNNVFKADENSLIFAFSVPEFDKYTEVQYQYQLEGLFDDWSHLSYDSYISLNNLPSGAYTFKVRALIGNTFSNNIGSYSFEIERAWYFSNLMIVIYLLVLSGFVLLIHLNYKRHYKKKQQQIIDQKQREFKLTSLENEQEIMRLKNEKLKNEVESKNRELTISTMSIINKNEILNSIKKQLLEQNSADSCKHVIKTIDTNINNKKDWEFLEEAFNNADKNFLKKIKQTHPELTPNDLRFCAYLRLNLSSKEIAPLLNISVRSVEIKRYRLRKKLNLLHEKSLIEYILEV
jgi:DNA-binding CsgD family transcriptional regulator